MRRTIVHIAVIIGVSCSTAFPVPQSRVLKVISGMAVGCGVILGALGVYEVYNGHVLFKRGEEASTAGIEAASLEESARKHGEAVKSYEAASARSSKGAILSGSAAAVAMVAAGITLREYFRLKHELENGFVVIIDIPDDVTISADGENLEIRDGRAWFPLVSDVITLRVKYQGKRVPIVSFPFETLRAIRGNYAISFNDLVV